MEQEARLKSKSSFVIPNNFNNTGGHFNDTNGNNRQQQERETCHETSMDDELNEIERKRQIRRRKYSN